MKLIIGITGRSGSGKDLLASLLADTFSEIGIPVRVHAFGDALKWHFARLFRLGAKVFFDLNSKDVPIAQTVPSWVFSRDWFCPGKTHYGEVDFTYLRSRMDAYNVFRSVSSLSDGRFPVQIGIGAGEPGETLVRDIRDKGAELKPRDFMLYADSTHGITERNTWINPVLADIAMRADHDTTVDIVTDVRQPKEITALADIESALRMHRKPAKFFLVQAGRKEEAADTRPEYMRAHPSEQDLSSSATLRVSMPTLSAQSVADVCNTLSCVMDVLLADNAKAHTEDAVNEACTEACTWALMRMRSTGSPNHVYDPFETAPMRVGPFTKQKSALAAINALQVPGSARMRW